MTEVGVGIALVAGILSFVSPCVLPLIPAYIGYMGGQLTTQVAVVGVGGGTALRASRNRFGTFVHGLFFVLGFTLVFIAFGLLTNVGSMLLNSFIGDVKLILARLGGALIIVFGLHIMGLLPRFINWIIGRRERLNTGTDRLLAILISLGIGLFLAWAMTLPDLLASMQETARLTDWNTAFNERWIGLLIAGGVPLLYFVWLAFGGGFTRPGDFWSGKLSGLQTILYSDTRQQIQPRSDYGYIGSTLMGVVFAAGWTPCIGPILGSILMMAAGTGSLTQSTFLLLAYSLGLGIPFLLTALALDQMQGLMRRLQRHMRKIELISGIFLILIGVLIMTGQLQRLSSMGANGEFALNLEHCGTEFFAGRLPLNEFGQCMAVGLNYVPVAEREAEVPAEDGADDLAQEQIPPEQGQSVLDSVPALGSLPSESSDQAGSVMEDAPALGGNQAVVDLPDEGTATGLLAPDFSTTTYTGQDVALSDHRGEVVLLNFWATWCGPCRAEMPEFQRVLGERRDEGFTLLAVSQGDTSAQISDFAADMGITFPLLMDEDISISTLYQIQGMPTSFILNRDGVILARHQGPMSADQLNGYLDRAFAETCVTC